MQSRLQSFFVPRHSNRNSCPGVGWTMHTSRFLFVSLHWCLYWSLHFSSVIDTAVTMILPSLSLVSALLIPEPWSNRVLWLWVRWGLWVAVRIPPHHVLRSAPLPFWCMRQLTRYSQLEHVFCDALFLFSHTVLNMTFSVMWLELKAVCRWALPLVGVESIAKSFSNGSWIYPDSWEAIELLAKTYNSDCSATDAWADDIVLGDISSSILTYLLWLRGCDMDSIFKVVVSSKTQSPLCTPVDSFYS